MTPAMQSHHHADISRPASRLSPPTHAPEVDETGWVSRQRRVYAERYRHFRALHDFLRYDARYRLFLMEEVFRAHDIPFEHQRVFELGFGTGSLLLRFDTSSSLHGSEISESAVSAMRRDPRGRAYKEAKFVLAQPDGTPSFPDTNYDIMIASHVIEHVPDDRQYLELMAQHTRPGGHGLFFSCPSSARAITQITRARTRPPASAVCCRPRASLRCTCRKTSAMRPTSFRSSTGLAAREFPCWATWSKRSRASRSRCRPPAWCAWWRSRSPSCTWLLTS